MDSNLLKVFVAVAKVKSISLGAKELGFTQSNVTLRIKQLEKTTGYRLFHRTPKGVVLTNEGKKLYPFALDIVKKVDETILYMNNINHQEILKIGSTQSNATTRLIPFITKLNEEYPQMRLELFTDTTPNVLEALLNYQVDVAFLSGNPHHKNIEILNAYKEDTFLVEPKNKPSQNTILAYKESCAYYLFLKNHFLQKGNKNFNVNIFENYEIILGGIEVGMGVSLLPLSIIKKFAYQDKLKLTKIDTKLYTHLVCRSNYIPMISEYLKNIKL